MGRPLQEPRLLRLGGVGFLNAQPLLHGLLEGLGEGRVRLSLAEPAELARQLFEDELDAALAPVAPLAVHGGLHVVPGIAIGCDGPVRSVLLVADRPLTDVTEVWLDAASRTSVILARLILRSLRSGREPRYFSRPAAEIVAGVGGAVGGLLIGDAALAVEGRFPHVIDLGRAWKDWTGLPFVFAVWVARHEVLDEADCALLRASAEAGLAARADIADRWCRGRGGDAETHLRYLTENIAYRLNERACAGLRLFLDRAADARMLPPCHMSFVPTSSAPAAPLRASSHHRVESRVDRIYRRLADGERLSLNDGLLLYRTSDMPRLAAAARAVSHVQRQPAPETAHVSLVRKAPESSAGPCSREELVEQVRALASIGISHIVMEGPLPAGLHLEWFENLFRSVSEVPGVTIHGLCPDQVVALARLEDLSLDHVIARLQRAGLAAVAGSRAVVLTDRVRRRVLPAGCDAALWLEVMRLCHRAGMRSWATMEFGLVDTTVDRTLHLLKLRDLQDETDGVLGLVPVPERRGPTIDEGLYLRTIAVARLVLDNVPSLGVPDGVLSPQLQEKARDYGADAVYGRLGDGLVGRTLRGVRGAHDGELRSRG